jgi:hypothetical protein
MAISDHQSNVIVQNTSGIAPLVNSLNAVTTGAGTALDGVVVRQNAVATFTTSAGTSAGACQLFGSLDGVNFVALGSPVTTATASTTFTQVVQNCFMRYIRAQVTTTVVGGTVSASIGLSG